MSKYNGRVSAFLLAALLVGPAVPLSFSADAQKAPVADAVIEQWQQHWTIEADGSVRRREVQRVKLMNTRPIRRFADPRIDFRGGSEEVIIHEAKTIAPDGRTLDVPDYSRNLAGPGDTAGWPAYADWQQLVVSFSGIEPGAVLVLDYEVTSPPGGWMFPGDNIRLDDEYPIEHREVSVTVPSGTPLQFVQGDTGCAWSRQHRSEADGRTTYEWEWSDIEPVHVEPQSVPGVEEGARLVFTTAPDDRSFVTALLETVESAAKADEALRAFVDKATKDELGDEARVRRIVEVLGKRFSVVGASRLWRNPSCRPAAEIFRANYGHPLEAAALLAAAIKALDVPVSVKLLANDDLWNPAAPSFEALESVVVAARVGDETHYFDIRHGEWHRTPQNRNLALLTIDDNGDVDQGALATDDADPSTLDIRGAIALSKDGTAKGTLVLALSGVFVDPGKIDDTDGQRSTLARYVHSVLSGFEIGEIAVKELSPGTLRASVEVSTKEPLSVLDKVRVLRLGTGPAHLAAVPLPLEVSERSGDVQLADAFGEEILLRIELPKGASPVIVPAAMDYSAALPGGRMSSTDHSADFTVRQDVRVEDGVVTWHRKIASGSDRIPANVYSPGVRNVMNDLRTDASLVLAIAE
ncbi:MAG: DUF3857 domain-containing protein [Phycisphaerae bacterium]|nr:DUF3857 domain-containing protein [Phycisphaerae bacterium]